MQAGLSDGTNGSLGLTSGLSDTQSTYASSYQGPGGHQSTIVNYNNGNVDEVTDKNGQVTHLTGTGQLPGAHQRPRGNMQTSCMSA